MTLEMHHTDLAIPCLALPRSRHLDLNMDTTKHTQAQPLNILVLLIE
jgi:hypothetical protein